LIDRRRAVFDSVVRTTALLLCARALGAQNLPPYQYRLTPSPVLEFGRLTREPRFEGYVGVRESRSGDSTAFSIQRARLTLHALPIPFAALRIQADLSAVGRISGDSVPAIVLTDAYGQVGFSDTSGLKGMLRPALIVGQFRAPFSLEFLSPFSYLQTANRSRAVDRLSPRRDIGVYGQVHFGSYGMLAAALVNGSGPNRPNNPDKTEMAVGRLTVLPLRNLALAGKWLNQGGDHRWGYDGRLLVGRAVVEGEAIKQSVDTPGTTIDAGGGYVLASFRLLAWLQPAIKWERLRYAQGAGVTWSESTLSWTTYGVNLLSTDERERLRVQLNWITKVDRPVDVPNEFIGQLIVVF
jgi:hypothetical protein